MGWQQRLNQKRRELGAPEFQIVISVLPNGQVQVTGPLQKKEICMKMLELAAETIVAYEAETRLIVSGSEPVIVAPSGANGIDILKK